MKKPILLMLAVMAIFRATQVVAESAQQKYTCPMHPEVVMDAPGKCPKCGMTLVPMKEEEKRPTPNVRRPTPHEEESHATHDSHTTPTHETHAMPPSQMSMHSSVNVAE